MAVRRGSAASQDGYAEHVLGLIDSLLTALENRRHGEVDWAWVSARLAEASARALARGDARLATPAALGEPPSATGPGRIGRLLLAVGHAADQARAGRRRAGQPIRPRSVLGLLPVKLRPRASR